MLPQVEAFLQSSSKVKSFQIIDNDPLDEENYLLKIRGQKAQIDFQYISADEVHKGISAILQQPPEVQQEMVKYIKFGG